MEVFHRSTPLFTSQVDSVFLGISAQSCLQMSDSDSELEKYNSTDDDSKGLPRPVFIRHMLQGPGQLQAWRWTSIPLTRARDFCLNSN